MHLGKCLEQGDWDAIRKDLNKRPIEGIDGNATEEQIREILSKYGIIVGNVEEFKSSNVKDNTNLSTLQPLNLSTVSVQLWGTGNVFREFLHVDDMADACVHIM
jgi:GDP-L-fucose synthase